MNSAISATISATLLVIGGLCAWGAFHILHAKKGANKTGGWKEVAVLLAVLAGLGIAGGLSGFHGLRFLGFTLGIVPLWLVLAVGLGIWFLIDLFARHGWARTPILGFLTAAMIAVPVAGPAVSALDSHPHLPQVTADLHHHKG